MVFDSFRGIVREMCNCGLYPKFGDARRIRYFGVSSPLGVTFVVCSRYVVYVCTKSH